MVYMKAGACKQESPRRDPPPPYPGKLSVTCA